MSEQLRNGKRAAVLEALRLGNTRRAACEAAGVSKTHFYRVLEEDGTLRDAVAKAEAEAEQYALKIVRDAMPKSWQAAAWFLERRRSQEYGRSDRLLVLQAMQRDIEGMTDAQLHALAAGSGTGDQEAVSESGTPEAG